jgi:hypothetical protein
MNDSSGFQSAATILTAKGRCTFRLGLVHFSGRYFFAGDRGAAGALSGGRSDAGAAS